MYLWGGVNISDKTPDLRLYKNYLKVLSAGMKLCILWRCLHLFTESHNMESAPDAARAVRIQVPGPGVYG